jgi:uncharacterized membrane protein
MNKRPAVVVAASWALWVLVAAGAGVSLLVVLRQDEIAAAWSPEHGGDSRIQPLDFVPVIVVLYLVVALTAVFLIPLLRHGHNWARLSLAIGVAGLLFSAVAVAATEPPTVIRWCAIAAGALSAVTLVFLWHIDARRWCHVSDAAGVEEKRKDPDRQSVGS